MILEILEAPRGQGSPESPDPLRPIKETAGPDMQLRTPICLHEGPFGLHTFKRSPHIHYATHTGASELREVGPSHLGFMRSRRLLDPMRS